MSDDSRIEIKTNSEIEIMRAGGQILKEILNELSQQVKPGLTTWDLELAARNLLNEKRVQPAFLGYRGYPASLCASINNEVVHGIPSTKRILKSGDIIKLDFGILYKSFYSDMAVTVAVGIADDESQRLMDATKAALDNCIKEARAGNRLGDISHAIQKTAEDAGFNVVREYTGHGIGRRLHESPQIPNFGMAGTGPRLKKGMVFALETMVNAGDWETKTLQDGWTVITADGKRSAHFEHTVLITDADPDILTL